MLPLAVIVRQTTLVLPIAFVLCACSEDRGPSRDSDASTTDAASEHDTGGGGTTALGDASSPPPIPDAPSAQPEAGPPDSAPAAPIGLDASLDAPPLDAAPLSDVFAVAPDAGDVAPPFPPYPAVPYPPENPHTDAKAILGKILFWEEQLSSDDTVACGTCHRSAAGGSDPRAATSASRHPGPDTVAGTPDDIHGSLGVARCQIGDGGAITYVADAVFGLGVQVTKRKAPTYLDAMFAPDIFWDGRATSAFVDPDTGMVAIASGGGLESQVVGPPVSDVEMACEGRTWPDIHAKLAVVTPMALASGLPPDMAAAVSGGKTYPDLFQDAFGTSDITTRRVAFAIATHERLLTSDQTPWDRWNAGEEAALTEAQERGFGIFMGKARCNLCHAPPLFTNLAFHNLGFVLADFDSGRQEVTGLPEDRGHFKTPSLRNVGLREAGGLLHDGVRHGVNLTAVLEAYDFPPNADPNVDPLMQVLGLSEAEMADLFDFLKHGLTDPRVQNETAPFDRPKLSTEP